MPAVVVGAPGPGTLGMVRGLGQAGVPVILLDDNPLSPAMYSRYGDKFVIARSSGAPLVRDLLALGNAIAGPAVLFLTSDDAALTVSECRAELANHYRFRLPSHRCLTALMSKTSFQQLAESHGFPVPHAIRIAHIADLSRLSALQFPAIVKPAIKTAEYMNAQFARAYKVTSREQAETVCRRILPILPDLIVQEWIAGTDSDLYFCLQYSGEDGAALCSFTGRKISIWPPDVGVTASCSAAPDVHPILRSLTETFFQQVSFIGMGGIEFKRDARTGRFLIVEPTVGRIDGQTEIATLHGVNIPLAAYLCEAGLPVPRSEQGSCSVIWRDFWADWRSARGGALRPAANPDTRIYDAYWRLDDPLPALFHALEGGTRVAGRTMRRAIARPSSIT